VEVVEREETLVAETCNHPNCLVLPFQVGTDPVSSVASVQGHRLVIASVWRPGTTFDIQLHLLGFGRLLMWLRLLMRARHREFSGTSR
jgi:hypothetical protein